jgi:cell division protein FtsI/penicillin-binding protein 2
MQEVLNQSLNTGMVFVMKKMGRDRFSAYMKRYAFGEETGIELPGEIRGLTENLDSPRDVEHATAAFGQGIATTPIGTARALAALGSSSFLRIRILLIVFLIHGAEKSNETAEPKSSEESIGGHHAHVGGCCR